MSSEEIGTLDLLGLIIMSIVGCATTGKVSVEPGILVITDIPEEYNDKFVRAIMMNIPEPGGGITVTKNVATTESNRARTLSNSIKDNAVSLPVYETAIFGRNNGYDGSEALDVILYFYNSADLVSPTTDIVLFANAVFENGVSEVSWNDVVTTGFVKINNIPENYGGAFNLHFGISSLGLLGSVPSGTPGGSGHVRSGASDADVFIIPRRIGGTIRSFEANGPNDVIITIAPKSNSTMHTFLFENVEFTDGKAVIDFRNGKRQ